MRNGYNFDTLTSADTQEIVKSGSRVIEIHEGVVFEKKF